MRVSHPSEMSAVTSVTLVSRPRTRRAAPRVKTGCKTCKYVYDYDVWSDTLREEGRMLIAG